MKLLWIWEKWYFHQLNTCLNTLQSGSGDLLVVRANYGTGILPSLFGAQIFMMDNQLNTLPTTKPLHCSIETLHRLIEHVVPNLEEGPGKMTLEMGEYYKQLFERYPNILRYIAIYHHDFTVTS